MRSHFACRLLLCCLILLLAACRQDPPAEEATAVPTRQATPTAAVPASRTPRPATPTPSPTPEPPQPAVVASDQELGEAGVLVIDRVTAVADGWLVVHADSDGAVGQVLGHTAVSAGENEAVEVTVDPLEATETLYAMLHVDAGQIGRYEFPGEDEPVLQEETGTAVTDAFQVQVQVRLPEVAAGDQTLSEENTVQIAEVFAVEPGWVAVQADEDGGPGVIIGQWPVEAGQTLSVTVPIDPYRATPQLHAVLYEDEGERGRFEFPDVDLPVLVNARPVAAPFTVLMPPDVLVYDQPIVDGAVVIERATSYGPGWLVVYNDNDGQIGLIIGQGPLEDGLNEFVPVELVEAAVSSTIYAVVHEDTGEVGEFNYPADDPQVRYGNRLQPFPFRIDAGGFLIARDQPVGDEGTVTIARVVADSPVWAVVRADDDGAPGEVIGQAALAAGYHWDVAVPIDESLATETLYVSLYLDVGEVGSFEVPGADQLLQQNGRDVIVPFQLLPPE